MFRPSIKLLLALSLAARWFSPKEIMFICRQTSDVYFFFLLLWLATWVRCHILFCIFHKFVALQTRVGTNCDPPREDVWNFEQSAMTKICHCLKTTKLSSSINFIVRELCTTFTFKHKYKLARKVSLLCCEENSLTQSLINIKWLYKRGIYKFRTPSEVNSNLQYNSFKINHIHIFIHSKVAGSF